MTDYDKRVGAFNRGIMRIRVNATTVQLYVKVEFSSTNWGSVGTSWTGPGGNSSTTFGYPGGQVWVLVTTLTVTTSGTVSWTVNNTGTSEFGGPHTHSVYVSRSTVPAAPTSKTPTNVSFDRMTFEIDDNSNGGSAITERQVQWSTSSNFSSFSSADPGSNGIYERTGMSQDTTYYWRGRVRNAIGWSSYSTVRSAKTATTPAAPTSKALTNVTHNAMTFEIDDGANNGLAITSRQYQYSTSSTFSGATAIALGSNGIVTRSDLAAGTTYYWRGRVYNAAGYSNWSTVRSAKTAGVPAAPSYTEIRDISHTGMTYEFFDGTDGGSAITGREYQYSTSSAFTGASVLAAPSNGVITRTDLVPGTLYYWRSRLKNAAGNGPWSAGISARTLAGTRVRVNGVWVTAVPYVRKDGVWELAIPYVRSGAVWKVGT